MENQDGRGIFTGLSNLRLAPFKLLISEAPAANFVPLFVEQHPPLRCYSMINLTFFRTFKTEQIYC